jgi:hypothetical protein
MLLFEVIVKISGSKWKFILVDSVSQNSLASNFLEVRQEVLELFHAYRRMDR